MLRNNVRVDARVFLIDGRIYERVSLERPKPFRPKIKLAAYRDVIAGALYYPPQANDSATQLCGALWDLLNYV